ncbi:hypothetical protein IE53DRAFT_140447 [Violaceomyces palustris]|uniref:Uncharacterized protein n=1 Tax=Violaceomyces palustris TaxID=1673888 RepID=A0ACD0P6C8_9BASI|nr:hypothetical protein IE53DRAFT_140447 [Violaceomyces palustris]
MADDASYGSRENLRRRAGGPSWESVEPRSEGFYQPGQPIGFLAARGTPYEKKYMSKKLGWCCLLVAPPTILITLVITLIPVLYAVGNHALHTSHLLVYESNITAPGNTSFPLTLEGQVKKTGIFPAHLYFREPVKVFWKTPPPELREVQLGVFNLDYIGVAAGHGRIKQATNFQVTDEDAFGQFAAFLITQPEFTWKLSCDNVHVAAFSFLPTYKNLKFRKNIVIKGFNNFEDVGILDFQLPGDDPEGGITFSATTTLTNPSPFGIEVGTLDLGLYYKGMYLGPASVDNVNITAGVNVLTLGGRLIPHTDNSTELDLLGELFTAYINSETVPTTARGVSVRQANGETVSWLSQGISALNILVPLKAPTPINPLKSITIGTLGLIFTPETSYNPITFSNQLSATLGLPFGFSLAIVSTANQIGLSFDGAKVATIDGAFSNSTTKLSLVSAGQTAGVIDLTLPDTTLTLANNTEAAKRELENFEKYFTFSDGTGIRLTGAAKAVTDTPLGRVLLNGIKFDVDSGILGLQGLTKYPTVINSVDVTGGTRDGINLIVATSLVNPSNLNLTVGDATFQLLNEDVLGTVTLPNLRLEIGKNDVNATSVFNPNVSPKGYETLNRFISGQDTRLNISGFEGSTAATSLIPALSAVRLNATLPGLKSSLVQNAKLTVLDTTGVTNDVANSIVSLANPFTTDLTITSIKSNVTSHGIFVASIDTPLSFGAKGKATSQSPNVPLNLNLYPPDIFGLVRALVVKSGQNTAQLDGIVALGGYTLTPSTQANSRRSWEDEADDLAAREMESEGAEVEWWARGKPTTAQEHVDMARAIVEDGFEKGFLDKRDNIYTGFNLPDYIDKAFQAATVNLEIVADTTIGDYGTTLTFSQTDVPLVTDDTLNKLLPVLAGPIVQKIVDGALLSLDRITILDPQQNTFNTALQGSITQSGPFDAVIAFTEGLTVNWEGRPLGQIAFPNVSLAGDVGAQLNLQAQFAVADVGYLTEFTKFLLTQPSFVWNIAGKGLSVNALGIQVNGITISKDVILTGFNGLQNSITINSFDLPYNDPAGGIHLTVDSSVVNPSQVGVQLSRFGVGITRNDTYLGPSAAASEFILQALATTQLPLVGRLVRQDSEQGLAALSEVFTRFVHDQATDLVVHGDYAGPESCTWLNDGIKVLNTGVSLPSQKFDVIKSITLNQLSLFFTTDTAWSPPTSSDNTTSAFFLPFAFPIDIQQVGGGFIANYQGQNAAVLNIPPSPSVTDVAARILTLMFTNVPFQVYNDKHRVFSQFLADTTAQQSITFNLNGNADTKANTAAGLVSITQVPFSVDTTLLGLQNLNARPAVVSNLDVYHGYPSYLLITITATLFNPSQITIGTGDVSFDLYFQGQKIGQAIIRNLVLVPGVNDIPTEVRYQPQGGAATAAGQLLLENYVQGIVSDTVIQGTRDTTPIESLKQALSGIQLKASIPALQQLLIIEARLVIPKDIAQTGYAQASFMLQNPFTASINLLQVKADASYQGIFLGEINENLRKNIISAPGHTTITSYFLPFKFNLDPKTLIRFVAAAAAATGTDLGPLPPLFQQVLGQESTQTTISPYPDSSPPPCSSGKQFDVLNAILNTLKGLKTTLNVESTVKLDDYQTDLDFVQQPVPTDTDNTALYLLGPAGAPIVQNLVNQATLTVAIANVTGVTNNGFDVSLQGALLGTGPFDAYIEFPEPLTVTWDGSAIATLSLPPICAAAYDGVPDLRTSGKLVITNLKRFTDFATYILHNPGFQWTVSSNHLRVRALGIAFSDVIISKNIDFKAFNNLPGVTISNFDIPSETSNALNIQTDSLIPSPATLGIELDTANFEIFFMGSDIGPVHSNNLFLAALSTTATQLVGQIKQQSGQGLVNTGILFSNFLQGKNQTLQVKGVSVVTQANGNQPVNWLTAAFKTLTLDVILPGKIYQIIYSITLSDLTVKIRGDPANSYTVPSSSNQTLATFSNPFHFSLTPIKAAPKIVISYAGGQTASLDLPLATVQAGTSRAPEDIENLQLMWKDQNIIAIDRPNFQAFFAQLTDKDRGTFGLNGGTDVVARTVIGDITITSIPFNVTTSLSGINSFNGVTTLSNVKVSSGTNQFIWIPLTVQLANPSNLTVFTDEVFLPVIFSGEQVGKAEIPTLGLIPGNNLVQSYFYYEPANANSSVAQNLLQRYLQPDVGSGNPLTADLVIDGSQGALQNLTPYDSLRPALAGVKLTTTLAGIASRVVTQIRVYLSLQTILSGLADVLDPTNTALPTVEIEFDAKNEIDTDLFIETVQVSAKSTGSTPQDASNPDARVSYTFTNQFRVPAKGTGTTPNKVPNVVLPKGLLGSLGVIGKNLDLYTQIGVAVGPSQGGGYQIPALNYNEINIPTTYYIDGTIISFPITGLTDLLNLLQGLPIASDVLALLNQININDLGGTAKNLVCTLDSILKLGLLPIQLNQAGCPNAPPLNSTSSNPVAQVTSVVGNVTSAIASAAAPITSAVDSVAAQVTSAAAPVQSAVSSVAGGLAGAVGGLLGGGGGGNSASASSAAAPTRRGFTTPTPLLRRD